MVKFVLYGTTMAMCTRRLVLAVGVATDFIYCIALYSHVTNAWTICASSLPIAVLYSSISCA